MSGPAIQHSIAAAQHAASTAPLPGTHSFWITLLIGLLIARIAPGWVFGILVVVALGALGVLGRLSHTSGGGGASILVWLIGWPSPWSSDCISGGYEACGTSAKPNSALA